ncbi:MAG: hypothetical protein ACOX24_07880 [Christensenellales bacterium]|jgi:hypothetical protein|nr:hypothetical protein [Clostridiales bacterium]
MEDYIKNDSEAIKGGIESVVENSSSFQISETKKEPSSLKKIAKAFMIVGTVVMGLYLIPLIWCLPMTISYSKKIEKGEEVSAGFKICTLLFVNMVAGILMLADNEK